jgi:hypothetical protein
MIKKILDYIATQGTERVWIALVFTLIILLIILINQNENLIRENKELMKKNNKSLDLMIDILNIKTKYFATDYITTDYEAQEFCVKIQK